MQARMLHDERGVMNRRLPVAVRGERTTTAVLGASCRSMFAFFLVGAPGCFFDVALALFKEKVLALCLCLCWLTRRDEYAVRGIKACGVSFAVSVQGKYYQRTCLGCICFLCSCLGCVRPCGKTAATKTERNIETVHPWFDAFPYLVV